MQFAGFVALMTDTEEVAQTDLVRSRFVVRVSGTSCPCLAHINSGHNGAELAVRFLSVRPHHTFVRVGRYGVRLRDEFGCCHQRKPSH